MWRPIYEWASQFGHIASQRDAQTNIAATTDANAIAAPSFAWDHLPSSDIIAHPVPAMRGVESESYEARLAMQSFQKGRAGAQQQK